MSRKLLCTECNEETKKLAKKYDELFESIGGKSNNEYKCDDCGKDIHTNGLCFASVLLPNQQHHMYNYQKPTAWMNDYFQ